MIAAFTHQPSPRLVDCLLTYLDRQPLDVERARQQHRAYCALLESCGVAVSVLSDNLDLPDSVFIEDSAVVLDELAVITRPGAAERRLEVGAVERALAPHRRVLRRMEAPAQLEGGDVLRVGQTLYVGLSPRTNAAGVAALEAFCAPYGYRVVAVTVNGCLHLKTGCTALDGKTLLANPDWVDVTPFVSDGFEIVTVDPTEAWAANILPLNGVICAASAHLRTANSLRQRGYTLKTVDISEFARAEGGLTCLSLIYSPQEIT